jgi:hypothetical protein
VNNNHQIGPPRVIIVARFNMHTDTLGTLFSIPVHIFSNVPVNLFIYARCINNFLCTITGPQPKGLGAQPLGWQAADDMNVTLFIIYLINKKSSFNF